MKNGNSLHISRKITLNKFRGFTMIEVIVVLILVALIIPTVFFLVGNVYKYVAKVSKTVDIRNDAINIFTLVRKDIKLSSSVIVDPDNDGVKIYKPGRGVVHYHQEGEKILRSENGKTKSLSGHPLENSAWAINNDILLVELTFRYRNLNSRETCRFKIMDNFEIRK